MGEQPSEIDVNSPDWHDGFETASAEKCFNERHEIEQLQARAERLQGLLEDVATFLHVMYDQGCGAKAIAERIDRDLASLDQATRAPPTTEEECPE